MVWGWFKWITFIVPFISNLMPMLIWQEVPVHRLEVGNLWSRPSWCWSLKCHSQAQVCLILWHFCLKSLPQGYTLELFVAVGTFQSLMPCCFSASSLVSARQTPWSAQFILSALCLDLCSPSAPLQLRSLEILPHTLHPRQEGFPDPLASPFNILFIYCSHPKF